MADTRDLQQRLAASQIKVAEMQEAEATFKAQAARAAAQREEETTAATRRTHEKLERQAVNCLRPTTMLRPDVKEQEKGWSAAFGEVVGIGPTPELACQDFDRKWLGKDEI